MLQVTLDQGAALQISRDQGMVPFDVARSSFLEGEIWSEVFQMGDIIFERRQYRKLVEQDFEMHTEPLFTEIILSQKTGENLLFSEIISQGSDGKIIFSNKEATLALLEDVKEGHPFGGFQEIPNSIRSLADDALSGKRSHVRDIAPQSLGRVLH